MSPVTKLNNDRLHRARQGHVSWQRLLRLTARAMTFAFVAAAGAAVFYRMPGSRSIAPVWCVLSWPILIASRHVALPSPGNRAMIGGIALASGRRRRRVKSGMCCVHYGGGKRRGVCVT